MNTLRASARSQLRRLSPYPGSAMADITEALLLKEAEINNELEQGVKKPFSAIVRHSGDAQAMGQKPNSFLRQVLAVCTYTKLFIDQTIPEDVKQRAREILDNCEGKSIGDLRFGVTSQEQRISRVSREPIPQPGVGLKVMGSVEFVNAARIIFKLLIDNRSQTKTGIMIPIPNSPLLSECIALSGGAVIPYSLDEEQGWNLDVLELRRALSESRRYCSPKVLCVVNPGNPTGQMLSRDCIENVIRFAAEERLFLLADEASQESVHGEGSQFQSLKKVLFEMGPKYSSTMDLVSLFSISKGHIGEPGARGCVMELTNLDSTIQDYLNLLESIYSSCPKTAQIAIDVATNPPQPGDPSYQLFMDEKRSIQGKMIANADLTEEMFNSVPGMCCQPISSGVYAFPRIEIPAKAIEEAKLRHQEPDLFYCLKLLEETGHLVIPGKVFGQQSGTYHFRMGILAPTPNLKNALKSIAQFHPKFTAEFS
ncbi:alanine aminotransferase 2-like [Scyliorhinus canicula]|uniref:alanine aminotransferase 2-like n=1 Tax=Scyliorhinus canicula TaxID=7830 RepID=UPI0018F2B09D|nr:alanine aminotransferase 2-like [Scyliorhinus canicula]